MALKAVVFDLGETLVDETRMWERAADAAGVSRFTLLGGGLLVAAVGNTPEATEELLRPHVQLIGSSARWGVEKPSPAFFGRVVDESGLDAGEIASVGDRVGNDVEPAVAAEMVAVHVRRGPWAQLHEPPPPALRIGTLDELPEALGA